MLLKIFKHTGEDTGKTLELPKSVFGVKPNDHVIYLDVKRILASQRQGTHKTKEKGEVKGSTRKLRKQKGSGNVRVGSIKSPIFRGGGRIFGPKPRKYDIKINHKTQVLARKSALTHQAQKNNIILLEDFLLEAPKTKQYLDVLRNLNLLGHKTLLVTPERENNLILASRNLQHAKVQIVNYLNTYEILLAQKLILSIKALTIIQEALQ